MVSQWGIKFAVHLITAHFGKIVAVCIRLTLPLSLIADSCNILLIFLCIQNVAEKLLNNGPLTLELVARYTELSNEHVKNSLLVLIQHNCVQAFTEGNSKLRFWS